MPFLNARPMLLWTAFATTLLVACQARSACSITVLSAALQVLCGGVVNCDISSDLRFRTPWPANDGKQHAIGELNINLNTITTRTGEPITADEWKSLVVQLPVLQTDDHVITLGDSVSNQVLARKMTYDLNALLLTGSTEVRWNWVTPLRASAAKLRSNGGPLFYVRETIHVSNAALCQKLDYWPANVNRGGIYTGHSQGYIRHSLNTTNDNFSAPVSGAILYTYDRHLFVRARPTNLNFGSNPTGKTMKRDLSIGVSTSSQAQVRYTFSYASISKTREEVLIDGRSLPAQFTVSVPASNIASFTDFKHQVSLTSPDAGKIDGYIRVVAEML